MLRISSCMVRRVGCRGGKSGATGPYGIGGTEVLGRCSTVVSGGFSDLSVRLHCRWRGKARALWRAVTAGSVALTRSNRCCGWSRRRARRAPPGVAGPLALGIHPSAGASRLSSIRGRPATMTAVESFRLLIRVTIVRVVMPSPHDRYDDAVGCASLRAHEDSSLTPARNSVAQNRWISNSLLPPRHASRKLGGRIL
jgi:hypothetical protein